jgi:hypothetical protein
MILYKFSNLFDILIPCDEQAFFIVFSSWTLLAISVGVQLHCFDTRDWWRGKSSDAARMSQAACR